jgi:hypothetical protein
MNTTNTLSEVATELLDMLGRSDMPIFVGNENGLQDLRSASYDLGYSKWRNFDEYEAASTELVEKGFATFDKKGNWLSITEAGKGIAW